MRAQIKTLLDRISIRSCVGGWISFISAAALLCLTSGCQDSRTANLEQRVSHLEERIHKLEVDRTNSADESAARRTKLENCVADANSEFDKNVANNGTKNKNGTYSVDVPLAAEMQKQKQTKIEECRLLYSK